MPDMIYSRVEPETLLHIVVNRSTDIADGERRDYCPVSAGLQVAAFRHQAGKTFRAHQHIRREREIERTQECWVVLSGLVRAMYYDIDGTFLGIYDLHPGDCAITLQGGHNYKILRDGTEVVEVKTGPFVGVGVDKEFIE